MRSTPGSKPSGPCNRARSPRRQKPAAEPQTNLLPAEHADYADIPKAGFCVICVICGQVLNLRSLPGLLSRLLEKPCQIAAAFSGRNRDPGLTTFRHDGRFRARFDPTMHFGMAIGKGKAGGASVDRSRQIDPGVPVRRIADEATVADAVRMFVHKDKRA